MSEIRELREALAFYRQMAQPEHVNALLAGGYAARLAAAARKWLALLESLGTEKATHTNCRHRTDEGRVLPSLCDAALLLQDIISKVVPISEDADGFITRYEIAVGPIHRAIPYLDQRGIARAVDAIGREE